MPGVGKLMKQAAKMQKKMQDLQAQLAEETLTVTSGGGAVKVTVTLQQELRGLELDPEFLKEDKAFVEETLLEGLRQALEQSREKSEAAMNELSQSMQVPGMPSLF
ncbi:MAG: YbaB/EbfC family nucleoid-associated protein [Verrucomicrobiota bacterium]